MRCLASFILTLLIAAPASAQIISGPAAVVDGDSLDMTGTSIRLIGIDAPEGKQSCTRNGMPWACGEEAAATLAAIIGGRIVTCRAQGTDASGRTLATCEAGSFDIGREMVRRGMAIVLDNAAPDYEEALTIAQRMAFGLWGAEFQAPAEWRAAHPQSAPAAAKPDRPQRDTSTSSAAAPANKRYTNQFGCAIKGNRSIRGEWIYHLPGQRYYEATRPEELFCTESEAIAAGYRRSKA
jgi:endonuclease YncB( thermonuclease family)